MEYSAYVCDDVFVVRDAKKSDVMERVIISVCWRLCGHCCNFTSALLCHSLHGSGLRTNS